MLNDRPLARAELYRQSLVCDKNRSDGSVRYVRRRGMRMGIPQLDMRLDQPEHQAQKLKGNRRTNGSANREVQESRGASQRHTRLFLVACRGTVTSSSEGGVLTLTA